MATRPFFIEHRMSMENHLATIDLLYGCERFSGFHDFRIDDGTKNAVFLELYNTFPITLAAEIPVSLSYGLFTRSVTPLLSEI